MIILNQENNARAGEFMTPHGKINTPVFMNVGTLAAIKGAVSAEDLRELNTYVLLCNTYHLHLRPTSEVIKKIGGLHKFTNWDKPILTDSGGFQIFSLSSLRKIIDDGAEFSSHINGEKFFMSPEDCMQVQGNLGSDIAMAFDECVPNPCEYSYAKQASDRTIFWLKRCIKVKNEGQLLFGINQGSTYKDLRIENAKAMVEVEEELDGFAIGGLAVGESEEEMLEIIDTVVSIFPENKPRYLMGVGTIGNIIKAVDRGIDMFDCVLPSRNARHGKLYTSVGEVNILNKKYELDDSPLDENCTCELCQNYSKAYLRHLFKAKEMLAMRLAVMHNLMFYNNMMSDIRKSILDGSWADYRGKMLAIYG